jgi:FkbM family methyltransferase
MREIGKVELGLRRALRLICVGLYKPWRLPGLARVAVALVRTGGVQALKNRLAGTDRQTEEYARWVERFDTLDAADLALIRERIQQLPRRPRISILMPVYNAPERWLRRAIESVENQLYPDWQLCIADDASTETHVRRVLEEYAARDPRITAVFRDRNGHIAEASNSALAVATGEFIALLDHDDELPPHALYLVAEEINTCPDVDMIYSDEDKVDEFGRRYEAYFKPDWDPDLFRSQNLFSHLGVYRTALVRKIGGFRIGLDGSQDYDLALRSTRETRPERIRHIPYVLYHWRAIETSTASGGPVKRYAFTAARQALREHFARDDEGIEVSFGRFLALYRVRYPLPEPPPLVSLIVEARSGLGTLRQQIISLRLWTDYPKIEVIVVADEVRDPLTLEVLREIEANGWARVLRYEGPFNHSALVNLAAREAQGSVLALLDWTLKPVNPDWLSEMVSHCLRPEIGAVGAKLLSRDGAIWHAGTILDLDGLAGYPHRGLPGDAHGYFGRAQAIQSCSAVSGECLVVRRETFERVSGFDAENLPVHWNDIDFCLRVQAAGYRNLWTPYAELRYVIPPDASPPVPLDRERAASDYPRRRWGSTLVADPHQSPNLCLCSGRQVLAWPPRRRRPWRDGPATSSASSTFATDPVRHVDDPARGPIVILRPPRFPDVTPVRMFLHGGRDQIAREIVEQGWDAFEQPLPDVFAACVTGSTGLVLDIGANTGFYTLLALASSRACTVHAFEPLGPVADLLDDNLGLNDAGSRVVVFRQAVSDRRGTASLFIPDASHGLIETSASLNGSFKEIVVGTTEVVVTTVDEHCRDVGGFNGARRVDIIKIDVESLEGRVLAGGARVLDEHRPLVFLEVLPPGDAATLEDLRRLHSYLVVRLRPGHAIVAKELRFDASGWNQMLVPCEQAERWLPVVSRLLTMDAE